jgi:hypothetical protein
MIPAVVHYLKINESQLIGSAATFLYLMFVVFEHQHLPDCSAA